MFFSSILAPEELCANYVSAVLRGSTVVQLVRPSSKLAPAFVAEYPAKRKRRPKTFMHEYLKSSCRDRGMS
jgi:hypothetical protein